MRPVSATKSLGRIVSPRRQACVMLKQDCYSYWKAYWVFVKHVRPEFTSTLARTLSTLCEWVWCNNRSILGKRRWANRLTEEKLIPCQIYPPLRNIPWKQWVLRSGFYHPKLKACHPSRHRFFSFFSTGFPSRLELQLFSLEDDECLLPMFIHALPAHHINQTLWKKKGQRHGDDI